VERAKRFVLEHFEVLIVLALVAATALLVLVVVDKVAFLNVFYVPTLLAAYTLGRRRGLLTGVLSVLLVAVYATLFPALFSSTGGSPEFAAIALWACFLLLTAAVVGTLYQLKEAATEDLRRAYEGILEILAKYIDAVDSYTQDHSVRVAALAAAIAREMGLPGDKVEDIRVAGLLHDVGKIDVSLDVLTKASRLTDAEWEQMKRHTTHGATLLQPMGGLLHMAVPIVLYHHERWDGSGYHGLVGEQIPLGARILAIADAYDSMVTDRPYRTGRTPWEALLEVEHYAGTQFDPAVVNAFTALSGELTGRPAQEDLTAVGAPGTR
jgi:putative nucleotidyltransferase with HDIG domain